MVKPSDAVVVDGVPVRRRELDRLELASERRLARLDRLLKVEAAVTDLLAAMHELDDSEADTPLFNHRLMQDAAADVLRSYQNCRVVALTPQHHQEK